MTWYFVGFLATILWLDPTFGGLSTDTAFFTESTKHRWLDLYFVTLIPATMTDNARHQLVRMRDLTGLLGMARSTIYALIAAGRFPSAWGSPGAPAAGG